ncbi:uncharacterized protein F54H12.2 [Trichonephila clavipes]|nr:uncharacterized protein F54H12.2 [Trichonephila clavipes]
MAFLLKDSPECAKSELNLFTLPPTQTVIEKGQWIQFHPIANVTDGGPVEFLISGGGEDYLDLSQTQLYVKAKILKNDGKVLTDDDKIGPVNLCLHSLFSQVDISLNGRNVSSSCNTYPYRAILETILNHGYDSKTSQLSSEIYYKDTAGRMNIYYDDDKEPNEGFNKRASLFKKSATVDMIGRLHVDLFNQDRLLLNLVDLKIKRILIWRERGSRNHPSNIIERDRYGGRGVLVRGGIMLGSRTDLHIFDAGSVNGTRYCNEILLPYVRLFRDAMGLQFLFMDDNALCHRTVAAKQLLESEDIERMDWPARSPDLNPIEHVWDFLGRRLAARTLPPVTIRELRLALQDE